MSRIYLDYNATTPLESSVLEIIHTTLGEAWGNPSSSHHAGIAAKERIATAREHIARMVNGNATDILFTSGGTEGNNLIVHTAMRHFAKAHPDASVKPHFVTSNLEHDSVGCPLRRLHLAGQIEVTVVPAETSTGAVDAVKVTDAVKENTCLVTVMLANNETGVFQPVQEIARLCRAKRASGAAPHLLIHTDAAQVIGKAPVDAAALGVDYLTVVGHKFYGPRIGALYVRGLGEEGGAPLVPLFFGGGQERNYRPGTENTGMIAGLGEAARIVVERVEEFRNHLRTMRDLLECKLLETFGDKVVFNGKFDASERLPNTCNFSLLGSPSLRGRAVLASCPGICASVGAACHSDQGDQPSPILLAIGVPHDVAANAMRWSVGRETTEEDITSAVAQLAAAVAALQTE